MEEFFVERREGLWRDCVDERRLQEVHTASLMFEPVVYVRE